MRSDDCLQSERCNAREIREFLEDQDDYVVPRSRRTEGKTSELRPDSAPTMWASLGTLLTPREAVERRFGCELHRFE